jgi:putative oxidoreductase
MNTNQLTHAQAYGITLLRVVLGIVFLMHGGQKLFVYGLEGVTGSFTQMGIPAASLAAIFTMAVEFGGGLALLLGLFTRVAAALTAVVMLGALFTVHLAAGFFLPNGYEFVLTLLAASGALVLLGSGPLAVDNLLARRSSGEGETAGAPRRKPVAA